MKSLPRKRRTREHVLAELSVNYIERLVLECGWAIERMRIDYGIDLQLFTFDRNGEIEEGHVLLQVKASSRLSRTGQTQTFPIQIDRRDLVHWIAQPMPVILIVYDARKNCAYWLDVQEEIRSRSDFSIFAAGRTVTLRVPFADVLQRSSVRRFARLRNRVLARLRDKLHDEDDNDSVR